MSDATLYLYSFHPRGSYETKNCRDANIHVGHDVISFHVIPMSKIDLKTGKMK